MLWRGAGYLLIFAPPAFIVAGVGMDMPALGLISMLLLLPLLRGLFGDTDGRAPEWTEREATILHALPLASACAYIAALGFALGSLAQAGWTPGAAAWFGSSLWVSFVFGSCVAHELVHRSDGLSRNAGRVLSGVIGYPLLEHDHFAHHLLNGNTQAGECPQVDETVWGFTWRRLLKVFPASLERDTVMAMRRGHRLAGGLPLAVSAFAMTACAFAWMGGTTGFLLYSAASIATAWSLQAITYIQHWGLEQNTLEAASTGGLGWEDRCRLQAWLTLSISFHQSHHQAASVPYYRQELAQASPKAPAGYVVLFFASLIPRLWRALMLPALERWKKAPGSQPTAGRALICVR